MAPPMPEEAEDVKPVKRSRKKQREREAMLAEAKARAAEERRVRRRLASLNAVADRRRLNSSDRARFIQANIPLPSAPAPPASAPTAELAPVTRRQRFLDGPLRIEAPCGQVIDGPAEEALERARNHHESCPICIEAAEAAAVARASRPRVKRSQYYPELAPGRPNA